MHGIKILFIKIIMRSKSYETAANTILIISVVLYAISLTQPCFCTANGCGGNWQGASIVGLGAIGGIMSFAGLTWYANPVLWVTWMFMKKRSPKALAASMVATAIALSFLLFTNIADKRAGTVADITAYQVGYWCWVASMLVMAIGSFILYPWMKRYKPADKLQPFVYSEEQLKELRSKAIRS
jgi:hypothetical protein